MKAEIVMHDRDTKFTVLFDEVLQSSGIEVRHTAYRSPNTNAFVERFIQTLRQECLDYFVIFGKPHMDYLLSEMVAYYHEERPHQAKEDELLVSAPPHTEPKKSKPSNDESPPDIVPVSQIECRERLGGLLKHYCRKAAWPCDQAVAADQSIKAFMPDSSGIPCRSCRSLANAVRRT